MTVQFCSWFAIQFSSVFKRICLNSARASKWFGCNFGAPCQSKSSPQTVYAMWKNVTWHRALVWVAVLSGEGLVKEIRHKMHRNWEVTNKLYKIKPERSVITFKWTVYVYLSSKLAVSFFVPSLWVWNYILNTYFHTFTDKVRHT